MFIYLDCGIVQNPNKYKIVNRPVRASLKCPSSPSIEQQARSEGGQQLVFQVRAHYSVTWRISCIIHIITRRLLSDLKEESTLCDLGISWTSHIYGAETRDLPLLRQTTDIYMHIYSLVFSD